jgi:uncharacterized membrane protein
MNSRVKVAGHPLHPMLNAFPLGLLATAVIFDLIGLVTHASQWTGVAYYLIGAGVIGGLAAAVPGWIDWFAIPARTRAKRIGLIHGIGNVAVVALFLVSWLLRRDNPIAPSTGAVVAGLLGLAILVITGWLGGELVDRLGVGVDDGAHLDAPSSLSALPARAGHSPSSHAGAAAGYSGGDRRGFPQPAYAGIERRRAGLQR